MPLTPAITLTATLDDLVGAAAGSTANPAKLRICLCGFGPVLPRIAGTAMLAKVGPFDLFSTGAAISTLIWGNDVITPSGTYYAIEILDGKDNVVQCGTYVFTGGGTQDLSSAPQIVASPVPQAFGFVANACTGTTPGTVFTVPTPIWGGSLFGVFYRGSFYPATYGATVNFTLMGQTLTMGFVCTEVPIAVYVQGLA
jgi:hypothetical protein